MEVVEKYRNRGTLPGLWVLAFNRYENNRFGYLTVLPLMAVAHILADLPEVLSCVEISREEYDSVFERIVECLSLAADCLGGVPIEKAIFDVFSNLLSGARDSVIHYLREIAWETAQRKRNPLRPPGPV